MWYNREKGTLNVPFLGKCLYRERVGMEKKKINWSRFLVYVFTLCIIYVAVLTYWHMQTTSTVKPKIIPITTEEFTQLVDKEEFKSAVRVSSEGGKTKLVAITHKGRMVSTPYDSEVAAQLELQGVVLKGQTFVESSVRPITGLGIVLSMSLLVLLILLGFMVFALMELTSTPTGAEMATPLGEVGNKFEVTPVELGEITLEKVKGIDPIREDILRIIDYMKNPEPYAQVGAKELKGLILYGPPGTGKTMLAKALATEAGVKFFALSGSDFMEKYVGVGAQRVRELYKVARESAPAIVFIDEVDAIGSRRGTEGGEQAQTLNALLTELDGFKALKGVVTICATNRLDTLDSALLRRLNLKLCVPLPDKAGRVELLKTLLPSVSDEIIAEIAQKTTGFSGAELGTLVNEAALIAGLNRKESIDSTDLDTAFYKVLMEGAKMPLDKEKEETKLIALHELGHALVALNVGEEVNSVTIIPSSSGAGGVTFITPAKEYLHTRQDIKNNVKISMGGRVAEFLYGGEDKVTTGASADIESITKKLYSYCTQVGMGTSGMLNLDILGKLTQIEEGLIYSEMRKMEEELYADTLQYLESEWGLLLYLSDRLIENETLNGVELKSEIETYRRKQV